jgi:tRNA A-37 threonylcarbamoyl transferase component Bud32
MYTPMNLRKFFQRSQSNVPIQAAHMTWASRTMAGTVAKTRRFLSRQIWVWPIIAVTLLLAIGWGVHGSIEYTMQSNLRSQLETLRDVEVAMLRTWIVSHQHNAASVAGDTEVRQLTVSLLESLSDPSLVEKSVTNESKIAAGQLVKQLGPAMSAHDYDSFFIATRETVVAAMRTEAIGMEIPEKFRHAIGKVFDGQTAVLPPFPSVLPQRDHSGRKRTGVPMMSVLAPIVDEHLQPVAALGLLIRPEKEFTRILQLGQLGQSGETYAFNREGLLLSNSRFDHDLILLGLLPDVEDSESILHLLVRDPGKDMTRGFRPKVRRGEMPLTRMAEAAVDGQTEADVVGYRGYRGVPVVGAWTWLDDYEFGVATEIDFAEAYLPLTILKRTFWGLLGLLAASAVAIFGFTVRVAHLQRQAREAAIEARQLGQYKLEEKLGEGAMGVVYKGRHAMLRRPTAIKLLDADKVTDVSITRFEREVQVTSHLNHPNTVAIYDYGRTPEEVFYYAMEYLDGLDLQQLVDTYGPQPAGRVIYLLRQVCGSLYEAHSTGLVHRDIKPANIMLSRRGGEGDVIKVLDFGLVKARDGEHASLDEDQSLAGTPLYMSPEAIQLPGSVDACSDLYALGAVGYFLLTGHPVFEADDLVELCRQHTSESPQPLSDRLGSPVPADLENAILACLEKDRSKRPQTARELANRLRQCAAATEWSVDEADTWWGRHERGKGQAQPAPAAKDTPGSQYDATIAH